MTVVRYAESRPQYLPAEVFPFGIRFIELGQDSVAYVDEGEGPALLFVHAGLWSFIWRDVVTELGSEFRCIALDFPGHGRSPATGSQEASIESYSSTLEAFVDALGLAELIPVMHDLGGPVGLGLAARRPELIRAMVFSQTFAWNPDQRLLRGMFRLMASKPIATLNRLTNILPRTTTSRFGIGRRLDRAAKRAFLGPYADRSKRGRFHELTASALSTGSYLDAIEETTRTTLNDRPTLSIFGQRNHPFGFQERLRATFADAEAVVVPKGAHFPMMDDPVLFADSVRGWCSGNELT